MSLIDFISIPKRKKATFNEIYLLLQGCGNWSQSSRGKATTDIDYGHYSAYTHNTTHPVSI